MINMFDFESQMVRIIPSFAGFTEFTTSIPKIYWDVKSQEQRIHGICKLLEKCIAYADMLGENVNEIAQTLQDIEDGKLDDLITAAIEAWFEEHESQILQDITDLEARVKALEDENVLVYQAISDEHDARVYQDGLLAQDISDETNARILEDTALENYTSIHNDTYGFVDPMKIESERNAFAIGLYNTITADDIESFTYAGKTVDEIFDSSKSWAYYIMPDDISGFPEIAGIVPTATGECSYDIVNDTLVFDSTGVYEQSSAYLQWLNMPAVDGHILAIFCLMESPIYQQGKFGIETSNAIFNNPNQGSKQIIGIVRNAIDESKFSFTLGNVPINAGLWVRENPILKSIVSNLVIIDLTDLYNNGQADIQANFVNAYNVYLQSKGIARTKTKSYIRTLEKAELNDLDAYDTFVSLMNQYSNEMGMTNSIWKSPSGYPSYPGASSYNQDYNNLSSPFDMLKILLACETNSFLQYALTKWHKNIEFGQASYTGVMAPPNTMVHPDNNVLLNYKRFFGKGGALSRDATTNYAPWGVCNLAASSTLKNGNTAHIVVMNTPYNNGSGLEYNNVIDYYYHLQNALIQIVNGTDPDNVVYDSVISDGMAYSAQPTSFAALLMPASCDKLSIVACGKNHLKSYLTEAKCYLGNNDGLTNGDTPIVTASLAKMLTAYIAVNECDLNDIVDFSYEDRIGGSTANQLGTKDRAQYASMTLRDAIIAMMYYSDNTIATAIARHVGKVYAGKTNIGASHLFMA